MARGGKGRLTEAGKREHTVSVRLTPEELERWHAARRRTPRKELGAWARAVIEESLNGHPGIPGDVAQVPEVNHAAYLQLAQAGNNLNQLTRYAHTDGALLPEIEAAIKAVGDAALAVRGWKPFEPLPDDGDQEPAEQTDLS